MTKEGAQEILKVERIPKMEHCIGFDASKVYRRSGCSYFKPHRNYYDAGGADIPIWESLKIDGFAECGKADKYGGKMFWLSRKGLDMLSCYEEAFIYASSARGNELDAAKHVIDVLLEDAVYCGYGCWNPSSSKNIAWRARLPHALTVKTLHYLQNKCGYVIHEYSGGIDDEGFPHCTHGWILTRKWKEEHEEKYQAAQKAEYKRMAAIWKEVDKEEEAR